MNRRALAGLPISFFARDAETVARELLGQLLLSTCGGSRCVGRIVETEAYTGPHDPASHAAASIGRTERNDPMFGPPATAYIHLNYGVHWCLNVVVAEVGFPAAVLIRALEPLEGLETMKDRRGREREIEFCSGPGKLTRALGIGPQLQRHPLREPPLIVAEGEPLAATDIVCSERIGIRRGAESRLRFYDRHSPHVSRRA